MLKQQLSTVQHVFLFWRALALCTNIRKAFSCRWFSWHIMGISESLLNNRLLKFTVIFCGDYDWWKGLYQHYKTLQKQYKETEYFKKIYFQKQFSQNSPFRKPCRNLLSKQKHTQNPTKKIFYNKTPISFSNYKK